MARPISSAEPEKLFRYSDFGMRINHELVSESFRLASRLQRFEATCTEPSYQVSVSHLAHALRSYGSQSESTDSWVRQVGKSFQMADQVWSGARFLPGTSASTTWSMPGWMSQATSLVALHPLLSVPRWLENLGSSVPWLKWGQEQVLAPGYTVTAKFADFAGDSVDALEPTFQTQKAFVGTLWCPIGRLLNGLAGSQRAGWVGRMEGLGKALYRSPVIKALDSPFGGALTGGTLELVAEGDYSFQGVGAAYTHSGLITTASLFVPGVKEVVVANALTQIGGAGLVWGTTRVGHLIASPEYDRLLEQNERRTFEALEKMDLTNVTHSAVDALWGKRDVSKVIDSASNVVTGTWEFAHAWNEQIAITGISIGDRLADALQDATESFLLQPAAQ